MFGVKTGYPRPLGATVTPDGVNFSLYARYATAVQLLVFEYPHSEKPIWTFDLNPAQHRTYDYWHIYVQGAKAGMLYAYRVDGPWDTLKGHRYNWNKVIVDPYAKGILTDYYERAQACSKGDNVARCLKGVVVDISDYDWEGDQPINRPLRDSVIYEMHVRGFTRDASSAVENPGTFDGLIEKIPYLKDLGITAVELLPVHQFDVTDVIQSNPLTGIPLFNFWGYSTIGFFAPHSSYSHKWDSGQQVREFRDMVKALHRAGIEVILDVVYNHTAEGDERGPTLSFRGVDNKTYYMLNDKGYYLNYSGTGNTVNSNHPVVRTLILDSLRFWVQDMHVDGFRFDLASILSRDEQGNPLQDPPIIWEIENDPILRNTKLIAEAWDAGGLYQVGGFPGYRWAEWNGKYRDDLRRFVKGDSGLVEAVAWRVCGSHDVYAESRNLPSQSINFITCHDGFTLNDLVSYNERHNYFNGENNQDGSSANYSWNCGVEGPTDDPVIEELRNRQVKNFIALLLVSKGTPMLLGGDEFRRSQWGNNNAYCQDNQISWVNWDALRHYRDVHRFTRGMIALRKAHPILRKDRHFMEERDPVTGFKDVEWHGTKIHKPDFGPNSHSIAFTIAGMGEDNTFHIILNAFWEDLDFELPRLPDGWLWVQVANTGASYPDDMYEIGQEKPISPTTRTVRVRARSVIIVMSNQ
jgi:glycogen operon protein